jgi:FtsH-binding integral membrane protein
MHMSKRDEKEEDGEKEDKKERPRSKSPSRFGHELWGVVFLSLGLLVFISLVYHFISRSENILGPYLGSAMSAGMMFLLGRVGAVLVPGLLLFVGWKNLTGEDVKTTALLFSTAFILEISLLFALHNMPGLFARTFIIHGNYFGNMLAYSLTFPFGPHRFGPYFICLVAILMTGVLCFRINPVTAAVMAFGYVKRLWRWTLAGFGRVFGRVREDRDVPAPVQSQERKKKTPKEPALAGDPETASKAAAAASGGRACGVSGQEA